MLGATSQSHSRVIREARAISHLAAPIALAQFGLMAMSLVDVVAGFSISITGAGRDVTME